MESHYKRLSIVLVLFLTVNFVLFLPFHSLSFNGGMSYELDTQDANQTDGMKFPNVEYSTFRPELPQQCPQRNPFFSVLPEPSAVDIGAALKFRSKIRGFHKKAGVLDLEQWSPEFKEQRFSKAEKWFSLPHIQRRECSKVQPPYQYPGCLVHINHYYKFIWVKGKKVGGTTLREPLGWICGDNWLTPAVKNMSMCSIRWYEAKELDLERVREYWSKYFVFAFVRNPYSRFASSIKYVAKYVRRCRKRIEFGLACRYPFVQPYMCRRFSCCNTAQIRHHIHHIMEQSSCLFTETGEVAVDFIGETESLNRDIQTILDVINARRDPSLPELKISGESLPRKNSHGSAGSDSEELYNKSPHCLKFVEHYFWQDFARLGYNLSAQEQ